MALTWYIDRNNIATEYGCYVEGSTGLMDMPKAKTPLSVDINDYHGELMDMEDIRYQPRDIVLSCFLIGTSMDDFNEKMNGLKVLLAGDGPHQLTITGLTTPVSYIVMVMDGFSVSKQWRVSGLTLGTFQVRMRELCPVKCVLTITTASMKSMTVDFLDNSGRIFWGDGAYSTPSETGEYNHGYQAPIGFPPETFYVVITGAINYDACDFGDFTVLWEQLL